MSKNAARAKAQPARLNPAWIVAGVALIVVAAWAVFASLNNGGAAGLPAEISVAEAVAKRDAGAFILDVRQPEEWAEYHVPGSTLIPLGELAARVSELPQDQEIVVVCRSGNRSQQGRDILKDAGFATVTSMAGGLSSWRSLGHPTVSGP